MCHPEFVKKSKLVSFFIPLLFRVLFIFGLENLHKLQNIVYSINVYIMPCKLDLCSMKKTWNKDVSRLNLNLKSEVKLVSIQVVMLWKISLITHMRKIYNQFYGFASSFSSLFK